MSLAILFHFLCAQHVFDINTSYIHHQELATVLLNYHIGRLVLSSLCVRDLVRLEWCSFCRLKHKCPKHVEHIRSEIK